MRYSYLLLLLFICLACKKNSSYSDILLISDESYKKVSATNISNDSVLVFQWNIGHFTNGILPNAIIEKDSISSFLLRYNHIVESYSPDLISLNEYSAVLYDNEGVQYQLRNELFNNYDYAYIGIQKNYSCNSIFSRIALSRVEYNSFNSNIGKNISYTPLIKPDDYYYITSSFQWNDKNIYFISAHLASDYNNEEISKKQINEIIDKFSDHEYVIMCGDWNVDNKLYTLFVESGYQLSNCGDYGHFITHPETSKCIDNIIVKGLVIKNVSVIETDLSDHYPLISTIILK